MIFRHFLIACAAFSTFWGTGVLAGRAASVSLYVFTAGEPVSQAVLEVDGQPRGRSNEYGAFHLELDPGKHRSKLYLPDGSDAEIELELLAGENVLLMASRPAAGEAFLWDIESSRGQRQISAGSGSQEAERPADAMLLGRVISLQTGAGVAGANIYVSGLRGVIKTDDEGAFRIPLMSGTYSLSVVHGEYSPQTLRGIELGKGKPKSLTIELTPSGVQLAEMVVAAPALEGGFAALVDEQRTSASVAEVIGAEQMSNTGDSDAAGALKRVTGLTLIDGKYIYVRGLGERYSSTRLNGAGLPSPDPTRKVVPLDLFPTGMLESVVIQKTYSPDMSGDFGGGTVQLRTRGIPDEKNRKVSLSLGGNTLSTFRRGRSYLGGNLDWIGLDDGSRAFPARLDELAQGGRLPLSFLSPAEREQAGEALSNNYATHAKLLPPDLGLKAYFADRYESYESDWGWGYNVSLNYNNRWRYREQERATYSLDGLGGLEIQDQLTRQQTENEIDLGGMLALVLELGESHVLKSTTLLSRKTTDTVLVDDAYLSENDISVIDTTLEWVERQLFTQQLSGRHVLESLEDLKVDWVFSYATAQRSEPDTRFYRYQLRDNGRYAFSQTGQSNERSFENLNDTSISTGIDLELPLYDVFSRQGRLKAGFLYESKQRESRFLRFQLLTDWSVNNIDPAVLYSSSPEDILTPENISPRGFELRNTTLPTDNYTASQGFMSGYLMGELSLTPKFKLMSGVRLENALQEVTTFQLDSPDEKNVARLQTSDVLPALSSTWQFSRDKQLRFSISRTLNRPDFKELSEAPYVDPETRDVVIGNPSLERALIGNADLRWEWYMTRFETFSVAAFYKSFDKPIERIIRLGAGGIQSFANAGSAVNYGLELQGRLWLSRLLGKAWSRFYIESNLALTQSMVDLGEVGEQQTNTRRPLQGQSPWVINVMLGYENLISDTKASLLFNMSGSRISSVGTSGLPDAYDQPAPLVDFVLSRRIFERSEDKIKMKLKIKNILDPDFETLRGGRMEKRYRKGRSISLGVEYKWKY